MRAGHAGPHRFVLVRHNGRVARTRVLRHESEAGRWDLAVREPDARLGGEVLVLEDYEERVAEPVRHHHLPPTFVPLILNFGPPYRVFDPADPAACAEHGSFVGGLGEGRAVTESSGTARCVQVNLTPLAARRLLGVPMHEVVEAGRPARGRPRPPGPPARGAARRLG